MQNSVICKNLMLFKSKSVLFIEMPQKSSESEMDFSSPEGGSYDDSGEDLLNEVEQKVKKIKVSTEMQKQISELAEEEIRKIKVIFQSEKTLLLSMIDQKIEERNKNLEQLLSSAIEDFKKTKEEISNEKVLVGANRQKMEEVLSHLDAKIGEIEKTKKEISEFLRQEFLVERASVNTLIESSTSKLDSLEKKAV